jgi:hypothetical protein
MEYPALPSSHDIRPDPGRLWAGGAATAIVAALIALVGILICRWTLGIPILAPQSDGAWGSAHTGEFVLAAAVVALAATAVLHLLMLGTPQPAVFLKWIMALVTLAAVVYPFSTGAPLDQKVATAVVLLVLGIAIASLLSATAARAVRRVDTRNPLRAGYGPGNPRGYGPGGYDRRGYEGRGYEDRPGPRGYDDRGYDDRAYGDREYGRPGPDDGHGRQGGYDQRGYGDRDYRRPGPDDSYGRQEGYDRRGYGDRDERRGYGRSEAPTRQYPPRDR